MKLIVQSDDYGFTKGVTYATHDAIRNGIITCTGLFANMPAAKEAVELLKDCSDICLGIDINVVSGHPCEKPDAIPSLVNSDTGEFIRSSDRQKDPRWMKEDLYPYDEVCAETEAQIRTFIELTGGKKPEYIHGHSIGESSGNYKGALHDVGVRYGIPFTRDVWAALGVVRMKGVQQKSFEIQDQITIDSEENALRQLEELKNEEYVRIGGHCGFVDYDLIRYSTFTVVRSKDYIMYTSDRIKKWIREHQVELITYRELYQKDMVF